METLEIHVTKSEIERGKRSHGGQCPVALAVTKALNRGILPRSICIISKGIIMARSGGPGLVEDPTIKFPEFVQKRIIRYDSLGKMTPFTFKLKIPAERLKELRRC